MEAQQDYSLKDKLFIWTIPPIAFISFKLIARTWNISIVGQDNVEKIWSAGKRVCYAGWHGRFIPFLHTHCKQEVRLLISLHRDGELLARVVKKLGFSTIRGSSSVGGRRAMVEMYKVIKNYDIALTPDGPVGPYREVQPGITYLSKRAEVPIVPVGISANSFWRIKSWDGFTIPKPFSKIVMLMGEPMWVKPNSSGNWLEVANLELQKILNQCTHQADSYFIRN
jgi:lysophospholipid acyltransferase (LPLAT)-like uncharacterized protein